MSYDRRQVKVEARGDEEGLERGTLELNEAYSCEITAYSCEITAYSCRCSLASYISSRIIDKNR